MGDNSTIIERFLEFGQTLFGNKHGWKSSYAKSLRITPQALNTIIDRGSIGAIIQSRLRELDADVDYIMTGNKLAKGEKPPVSQGDLLMLQKLKAMGIDSLEKLETFISPADIAQDVAIILQERMKKLKMRRKK